jgi:hypothetical protein
MRRLALECGAAAWVTAAWVRFPELTATPLRQHYTRLAADRYQYESPDHDFTAELTVDDQGLILRYGDLWTRAA